MLFLSEVHVCSHYFQDWKTQPTRLYWIVFLCMEKTFICQVCVFKFYHNFGFLVVVFLYILIYPEPVAFRNGVWLPLTDPSRGGGIIIHNSHKGIPDVDSSELARWLHKIIRDPVFSLCLSLWLHSGTGERLGIGSSHFSSLWWERLTPLFICSGVCSLSLLLSPFLSLFLSFSLCRCTWVCAQRSFFRCHPFFSSLFLRQGLPVVWNLPVRPAWLTREP